MEFLIFVIVLIALMAGVEYLLNRKLESNKVPGDLAKENEEFLEETQEEYDTYSDESEIE